MMKARKVDNSVSLSAITASADPPQSPGPTDQVFLCFSVWLCEFLSGIIEVVPRVVCFRVCVQWNLVVLIITLVVVVIILFGDNCKCPHAGCSSETIGIINVY